MRIYLHLSPNRELVPFNYQPALVGAFHKWLGPDNDLHNDTSLYSLSWLNGGHRRGRGLDFPTGATFWVSAASEELLSDLIKGVFKGHEVRWGMEVQEVTIQRVPDFGSQQRFITNSPVLIKRREADRIHYYYHTDPESSELMTQTMYTKMKKADLSGNIEVSFDQSFSNPRIKMIDYKGVKIKGSSCPVIVKGDPELVKFAWCVGVGNSSGIGFGALR